MTYYSWLTLWFVISMVVILIVGVVTFIRSKRK